MGKIFTVLFPDIGEGVVEGEVIEWRKNVGDSLKQDEPVVVVMTDKATVELPAPHPGTLAKQYYMPGGVAIKDKPLYDIDLGGESEIAGPETKNESSQASAVEKAIPKPNKESSGTIKNASSPAAKPAQTIESATEASERQPAIPKVRRLAKQLGIPLDEIQGSGKDGRITPDDLGRHKAQEARQSLSEVPLWNLPGDQELPLIGVKALMAKRMTLSKSQIPHFSYFEQAEATRLVQLRNNLKCKASDQGLHLTYMPFLIKAISLCIRKHPLLNSSYDKEHSKVILHQKHNIGIAMATSLGLIVPVLKGVESMTLEEVIKSYEKLIKRAHDGKLLSNDMKEATFTVSNFGSKSSHGLWATPVINYPEAAILATGRIHPQALIKNGEVAIRDVIHLSWSFDHRIIDGEAAAQISQTLCGLLENPAALL